MEYFLLYIILSTVLTLVSILFAYKPKDDSDGLQKRANSKEIMGQQKDRNPVYTKEPKKDLKGKRAKRMGSSLLSY